ncbi:toll/interleukin-1 receptor domain-containing protein [Kitasatospora sp. NPDC101183]|uniref:toll/interleukin-1 receptor domain-containing protein n=1 Tax=Kitasatospora sp. NPDC101183 TaxID=3364100 RepID=UPI00380613F6
MSGQQHTLFISHASEDKEELARPLAVALEQLGLRVWYDEFSLSLGDSLSASIDKGLQESEYGLIILSPSFLKKPWPEYEFRSLLTLEMGHSKRILPLWHKIDRSEVMKFSPQLADRVALNTEGKDSLSLALSVLKVASPEMFNELYRRYISQKMLANGELPKEDLRNLRRGEVGPPLTQAQLRRLRLIRESLMDAWPQDWEEMVADFRRDLLSSREKEINIWEAIAGTYLTTCRLFPLDPPERRDLVSKLIMATLGAANPARDDDPEWLKFARSELLGELANHPSS